tara:strand:+ start:3440 stop:4555 length:1116 start_codon:yes stop_codon:yes gene_type:complete
MVDLLVAIASLESPTDKPETQYPVQAYLTEALEERGFLVRRISGRQTGGHLYARPRERKKGRPGQLLVGHSDTVWPVGTLQSMPILVDDYRICGPGTFDMKAGLVQGIFALEALNALKLEPPATPVWIINSDEEIGSPESQRWVRMISRHVERAFVLEPAFGLEGRLKTARKGFARFKVNVKGIAAHSGLDPTAGASAIEELSQVILQIHALTDQRLGTTANVGTIKGGTRSNVVAASASCEVDVRACTSNDLERLSEVIFDLKPRTEGTKIEIDHLVTVPPVENKGRNRVLWEEALVVGQRLGIELKEVTSGGGSDGNTTSQFTATLDGLGAIGDGAHAPHEGIVIESMVERAALLAELLMAPIASSRKQ